jgi:hypothetical protein
MYFGGIGGQATIAAVDAAGLVLDDTQVVAEDESDGRLVRFLWLTAHRPTPDLAAARASDAACGLGEYGTGVGVERQEWPSWPSAGAALTLRSRVSWDHDGRVGQLRPSLSTNMGSVSTVRASPATVNCRLTRSSAVAGAGWPRRCLRR